MRNRNIEAHQSTDKLCHYTLGVKRKAAAYRGVKINYLIEQVGAATPRVAPKRVLQAAEFLRFNAPPNEAVIQINSTHRRTGSQVGNQTSGVNFARRYYEECSWTSSRHTALKMVINDPIFGKNDLPFLMKVGWQ
jgi:hypothetical protein